MLFYHWHPFSNPFSLTKYLIQRLKRVPLKVCLLSSVSCLMVLLSQSQALAFHKHLVKGDSLPLYGKLIYLAIGMFLGSVVTVESRRFKTFLLGLFLLLSGLWAIAILLHYNANLPYPAELWRYSVMGLGLGIIPIGLWWWGHRQGYFLAMLNLVFRQNSADPILARLLEYYEPEHKSADVPLGLFKRMKYQAAVVRYYRMFDQRELHAVDVLVSDRIQEHWQKKQAEQTAQQKQKKKDAIEDLLSQATEQLEKAPL